MTFLEKYNQCKLWHEKVLVIEIFHLTMCYYHKDWTVTKTAMEFKLSTSLVSENLKLAKAIHVNEKLVDCKSRVEALIAIGGGTDGQIVGTTTTRNL